MAYEPIFSPDTTTYLQMQIYRFPGYSIFLRIFSKFFGENYAVFIVLFQGGFGCFAVHNLAQNIYKQFKLNVWQAVVLLIILLYPFYPNLWIANNICSEGLSYPFYLLCITYAIKLLYSNNIRNVFFVSVFSILLCLTRGQFIIFPLIVAFIYFLKSRHKLLSKTTLIVLTILIITPVFTNLLDRSYHKLLHKHFVSTPFSYVNAITQPFFVSKEKDLKAIKNQDYKAIFTKAYNRVDSLQYLASHENKSYSEKYKILHDHFPQICNTSIHEQGFNYYYFNKKQDYFTSYINVEKACKAVIPVYIQQNLKSFILIYFTNVSYGFKSPVVAVLILIICLWSFVKVLKNYKRDTSFIFFLSLLIISNASIVAFACHSIQRYLFYNYFAIFIILILIFRRKFKNL